MQGLAILIVAAVDATGWRMRGSDQFVRPLGNTVTRLLTSAGTAAACWALDLLSAIESAHLTLALWAGSTLPWWDSLGVDTPRRVLVHSATCLLRVLPAALLLWWLGALWWPLLVAGALGGPAYRLAGNTERGELAWGAMRGAALAAGIAW